MYNYDANGNRTDTTIGNAFYAYNPDAFSNRLMTVAGPIAKSYSYDASGNALSDGNSSFIWNANGRLSKVITGAQIDIYQHNALGERISKRSSSALGNDPWRFIYDSAGHLLGEYDVNNNPLQETVWLGDLPVAVIKQDTVTNQPIVYYVHADHLNTPRVILNTNNTVVWRWDSDAFGVGAANQDPDGDGVVFVYNPRFPGQYYDAETGLYYNYQRTYDPALGRYLQSDPIGLTGGLNTYGYVGGNPVSFVDFWGLFGSSPDGGISCLTCHNIPWLNPPEPIPPSTSSSSESCNDDCYLMSKGGKQNIDNEYTREIKNLGKKCSDPCDYLRDKYNKEFDTKERLKIKGAMKYFNCDGKNRFDKR